MPFPVKLTFEKPIRTGYATTLMRFTQKDKDVVDKAARIMKMSNAAFMRMTLVEVAHEVVRVDKERRQK